jgi:hypothetical protein
LTVLGLWYWSERTISVNTVISPRADAYYWAAITFSQTLGTALGDWIADTGGLGYEGGALVFGAGRGRDVRGDRTQNSVSSAHNSLRQIFSRDSERISEARAKRFVPRTAGCRARLSLSGQVEL